jgi:hypothetical protein
MEVKVARRALALLSVATLFSALLTWNAASPASAHAGTQSQPAAVSPSFCQPASAEVILEGSYGHTYQCSGSYTVNDTTYYITAGGWSGYIDRSDGIWLFCDWQSFSMPFRWTYSIYLSPVKEPWCR